MGNTRFNFRGANEQIGTGLIVLIAGILALVNLPDETSMKRIIGTFFLAPAGILLTISGIVRKLRGSKERAGLIGKRQRAIAVFWIAGLLVLGVLWLPWKVPGLAANRFERQPQLKYGPSWKPPEFTVATMQPILGPVEGVDYRWAGINRVASTQIVRSRLVVELLVLTGLCAVAFFVARGQRRSTFDEGGQSGQAE